MSTAITLPKSTIAEVTRALLSDVETRFEAFTAHLDSLGVKFAGLDDPDSLMENLRTIMVPSKDEIDGLFKAGKGPGKRRKDPNAPKRSQSAYMLWLNANRDEIAASFDEELTGRDKVTKVAKKAGEMWKAMSEEDKQSFVDEAAEKREAYLKEKQEYSPSDPVYSSAKIEFEQLDSDEAPEGWSGPFANKVLCKYATSRKLGVGTFNTFQEAVAEAERLSNEDVEVGGITRDKKGYSIRKTNQLIDSQDGALDVSWVYGTVTVIEPKVKAKKETVVKSKKVVTPKAKNAKKEVATKPKKESTKSKKSSKKKAVVSVQIVGTPIIDVEEERFSAPAPKANKTKKSVVTKKLEPEPEPEKVELELPADEELELSEVEIDGESYYMNDANGDIYDVESEEKIGSFTDGELKLDA